MRIVGGRFRGRKLVAPADRRIRPTADRVRESLFDMLASRQAIESLRVIDLFAGTGALGLEAASRGASFVLFVENSAASRGVIRENIEALGLGGTARIFRRDATSLGQAGTMDCFDVAFADPPYGKNLGERAALALARGKWLRPGATLVLEEAAANAPRHLPDFELEDQRRYGDTTIGFFRYEPDCSQPSENDETLM